MTLWVILVSFLIILSTGASIGVGLGLSSAIVLWAVQDMPLVVVVQRMFTSIDSFSFMAVPFFMLAGAFMSEGGVTRRIVDFSMALVGALAGGLALVVAVAGMFFAALSGSSAATTAAIGASMIDEMERRGYPRSFAAAVVASGGTVGIVIPPSITMVVYGSIANTSVAELFMAGFLPGIIMGVVMCLTSWVISKRNGYRGEGQFSVMRLLRTTRECFWALMMPVIILGGIYSGIFTATEAAAVAAVYGAFVGFFIYRELHLKDLWRTLLSAAYNTTMIMFVVGAANLFGWILTNAQVPHMLAQGFADVASSPLVFLMLVNVLLLFIGTLINASAAIVILTPILLPVALGLGIDPVFFGVLMVINLAIGCITPPVGLDLFVVSSIAGISIDKVTVKVLPYLATLLISLVIFTWFPSIITCVPSMMK
ncbi:MAG: TRAP transporter large permease [Desulfovibrio sp.]|uniref:TRAP transporter large permease n=1 Tax=Desulfovibrio sp. TaxID=885 RepID=UPI001A68177D|nr:TRAP transporter large permease [Desulfovibrio sp.]MBD5418178.1 TRAP transporter large permease [Desulfovibrio sp.]